MQTKDSTQALKTIRTDYDEKILSITHRYSRELRESHATYIKLLHRALKIAITKNVIRYDDESDRFYYVSSGQHVGFDYDHELGLLSHEGVIEIADDGAITLTAVTPPADGSAREGSAE